MTFRSRGDRLETSLKKTYRVGRTERKGSARNNQRANLALLFGAHLVGVNSLLTENPFEGRPSIGNLASLNTDKFSGRCGL